MSVSTTVDKAAPAPLLGRVFAAVDIIVLAFALLLFGAGLWMFAAGTPGHWIDLVYDDAYYYGGVARGIIERGESSFAAPLETNGYQPLWLMLITAVAFVFGHSPAAVAVEIYTLSWLFMFGFAWLSRRTFGVAFPALLVSITFPVVMLFGLETCMLPVFFMLFMKSDGWRARGLWGSLLFLTRLDAGSLVLARDIWLFATKRKVDLKHWLIIAPVGIGYAAINQTVFGTPLPISGLAKAVGSVPGENLLHIIIAYAQSLQWPLLFAVCLCVGRVIAGRKAPQLKYMRELAIAGVALLFCTAYYGLASGWSTWGWYHWSSLLLAFYLMLELVALATALCKTAPAGPADKRTTIAIAALGLGGAALLYQQLMIAGAYLAGLVAQQMGSSPLPNSFGRRNLNDIAWVREQNLPAGTTFAMGDRAGSFGFFLDGKYRLLHTEGLVADMAYYRALAADEGLQFADGMGIDYWVFDRDAFLESRDIIGAIEPIQGMSTKTGPWLVCFRRGSEVASQGRLYTRVIFPADGRIPCPNDMRREFERMRSTYGGLHTTTSSELK